LEMRLEALDPSPLGRNADQRVLGDTELRVHRAQRGTKLLELRDRQAAVIRQDRDLRPLEAVYQQVDFGCFLCSWHGVHLLPCWFWGGVGPLPRERKAPWADNSPGRTPRMVVRNPEPRSGIK